MTATNQFIEDVKSANPLHFDKLGRTIEYHLVSPESWKAVGKIRGWEETEGNGEYPVFRDKWHQFIDELMKNKSIEEALEAIEN